MRPVLSTFSKASAALLMLMALAACDCFTCNNEPVSQSYIQLSPIAPPPPMNETHPTENSSRTTIWRPGYWDFSGGNFTWVKGELMARPSATATWSPDHWVKHTFGWGFVPGHWQ